MKGYVKLYRKIQNTSVWCDSDKLKLWLYCLLKAAHEPQTILIGNTPIQIEKGQFVTGRRALEDDFNKGVKKGKLVSGKTLERWLKLFEEIKMLSIKSTNKYTIVTINNWEKYQSNDQQVTQSCPNNDPIVSTYKNDKNEKNIYYLPIPLKDGTEYEASIEFINEMKTAYPNVNIEEEFRRMRAWSLSNVSKRKTRSGIKTFINNWLSKEQDKYKSLKPKDPYETMPYV